MAEDLKKKQEEQLKDEQLDEVNGGFLPLGGKFGFIIK